MPLPDPPRHDEIEVSVFGPGRGECITVHLGAGEWIVVDSCRNRETGRPIVLDYFDELELDPTSCVKAIVATHWHSDHIRGLAEIVEVCDSAPFWCTAAVNNLEFDALIDLAGKHPRAVGRRLEELGAIVAHRRRKYGESAGTPRFALEGGLILERHPTDDLPRRAAHVLSPSTPALMCAIAEVKYTLASPAEVAERVQALPRNDTSVVLVVSFGDHGALLGGDLECSTDPGRGWSAAVKRAEELDLTCDMIKIPHHGSVDAHDPQVWQQIMTDENAAAALTPYFAKYSLPREEDRARIRAHTRRAYVTSERSDTENEPALVEVALALGADVYPIEGDVGHVRWRRRLDGADDWRVELDERAVSV